ncbi:MAG: tetratricopeptide repeat protein, partial [Terriglobales bacterium]
TIMAMQPDVVLNARLRKRLDAKDVKGTGLIQLLGSVFLLCVLFDVGFSTFNYLEMLKHYYQSNYSAVVDKKMDVAKTEYDQAEDIRTHPLPISWVSNLLLSADPVTAAMPDTKKGLPDVRAGVQEARADALWAMGRKDEAKEAVAKAIELSPKSFRISLRMARMLAATGNKSKAQAQIQEAMTKHKDTFLPQLYMIALKHDETGQRTGTAPDQQLYKAYMDKLDEDLFGEEPNWPPGGDPFLHDIWYKEDVQFVFDRLVGQPRGK